MDVPHTLIAHHDLFPIDGDFLFPIVQSPSAIKEEKHSHPLPTDIPNLPNNAQLLGDSELFYLTDFFNTLQNPNLNPAAPVVAPAALGSKRSLDEQERKSRHVASEHKRRDRIKDELDHMMELVPSARQSLGTGRKSQARILAMANKYMAELQRENDLLKKLLLGRI